MTRRKTNEEFVTELRSINPNIIPLESYTNCMTKLLCKCKRCNYEWSVKPNSLLSQQSGCPKCSGRAKLTNNDFIERLRLNNPTVIPLEEYRNNSYKILCRCSVCNHEWRATPHNLLNGTKCINCFGFPKKTNEQFVEDLKRINDSIIPLEQYQNNKTKLLCKCTICDYMWKALPNSLICGVGCPKCGGTANLSNEEFVERIRNKSPNIIPLELYKNQATKMLFKCAACKYEWKTLPSLILQGHGCPNCNHTGTSLIEQVIFEAFVVLLGDNRVYNRDKTAIGKELDIYIPNYELAIEFGAWYWHKDKSANDEDKKKLCKKKGITLITILEDVPTEIVNEPHSTNDLYFDRVLSCERDLKTTFEIISDISDKYGFNTSLLSDSWNKILKEAKRRSLIKSENDFISELSETNPSIQYVEGYSGSTRNVLVRCTICGNQWSAKPYRLLDGIGCKICSTNKYSATRIHESKTTFVKKLNAVNPNIIPLEEYKGSKTKITCKCKICNNTWTATPNNLLRGHGCPKCKSFALSKRVICIETGEIYDSVKEAESINDVFLYRVLSGKSKTAGGFHWKYYDEENSNNT